MAWKNYGIIETKNLDAEKFTTDFGIKARRIINPVVKLGIKAVVKEKINIVEYPKLEKKEPYIFAAGHSFPGEIAANLASIDRNAYVLIGTTDQLDHNPQMYAAWLNGLIYVNRLDPKSRKECMKKMERVLNNGTSVLMFPEGVLNNSENLYCQPLFPGVYYLSQNTGKKVVPIVSHKEYGSDVINIAASEPIDLTNMTKKEALSELRDALSTLRYNLVDNSQILRREDLQGDIHLQHLERRKNTYNEVKWTKDVWEEEIRVYHEGGMLFPSEVWQTLENVQITPENAWIFAPILAQIEEDKKYDIVRYMKKNWNK